MVTAAPSSPVTVAVAVQPMVSLVISASAGATYSSTTIAEPMPAPRMRLMCPSPARKATWGLRSSDGRGSAG